MVDRRQAEIVKAIRSLIKELLHHQGYDVRDLERSEITFDNINPYEKVPSHLHNIHTAQKEAELLDKHIANIEKDLFEDSLAWEEYIRQLNMDLNKHGISPVKDLNLDSVLEKVIELDEYIQSSKLGEISVQVLNDNDISKPHLLKLRSNQTFEDVRSILEKLYQRNSLETSSSSKPGDWYCSYKLLPKSGRKDGGQHTPLVTTRSKALTCESEYRDFFRTIANESSATFSDTTVVLSYRTEKAYQESDELQQIRKEIAEDEKRWKEIDPESEPIEHLFGFKEEDYWRIGTERINAGQNEEITKKKPE
jgi:hypothetical protein